MLIDYIHILLIIFMHCIFQGRVEPGGQHQGAAATNYNLVKEVSHLSKTDALVGDGAGSRVVVDADLGLLYDFEKGTAESREGTVVGGKNVLKIMEARVLHSGGRRMEATRRRDSEQSSVNPDIQFQRDFAKAQAISLLETPGCLPAEQVIKLGIRAAAGLGILCRRPNLPLEDNSFVPMDGNCTFSSCCHANDPTLRGKHLKHAAWELRVRGVGTLVESLKGFNDEQWSVLQAIVTGNDEQTLSKEHIKQELEKYMESGEFSGNVGDLLPQLAADFLNQPLLVIVIENCQVTNSNWVEPGGLFGRGNQCDGDPIILMKQLQHFETLLVADEAKETARIKYQQWKASKRVGVLGCEKGAEKVDNEGLSRKDVPRNSQRFEELHQCNCGHEGHFASHLRSSPQCVQSIRQELSLGEEWSDEVLIVQATLVLGGCPAAGCQGGIHAEMPELCLSWWKEDGWKLMQWQGPTSDLTSAAIRERANKFVKELTQGYEDQAQNKGETVDNRRKDVDQKMQNRGCLDERLLENVDDTFVPPIASTPVQRRNEKQERRDKPAANVSIH